MRAPNPFQAPKHWIPAFTENRSCIFGTSAIPGGRTENRSCIFGTSAIPGGRAGMRLLKQRPSRNKDLLVTMAFWTKVFDLRRPARNTHQLI